MSAAVESTITQAASPFERLEPVGPLELAGPAASASDVPAAALALVPDCARPEAPRPPPAAAAGVRPAAAEGPALAPACTGAAASSAAAAAGAPADLPVLDLDDDMCPLDALLLEAPGLSVLLLEAAALSMAAAGADAGADSAVVDVAAATAATAAGFAARLGAAGARCARGGSLRAGMLRVDPLLLMASMLAMSRPLMYTPVEEGVSASVTVA